MFDWCLNLTMLILRAVAAFVLIAGTWWSMADVAWSSDFIQSHFAGALSQPRTDTRESSDGLMIIDDGYTRSCCADLDLGRALALFATLFGGVPMAGLAFIVGHRRRGRSLGATAEPFLLAAFVFQFASMVIASLLALLFAPYAPSGEDQWIIAYLFLTAVISGMALPIWHGLRNRVVPELAAAVSQ